MCCLLIGHPPCLGLGVLAPMACNLGADLLSSSEKVHGIDPSLHKSYGRFSPDSRLYLIEQGYACLAQPITLKR